MVTPDEFKFQTADLEQRKLVFQVCAAQGGGSKHSIFAHLATKKCKPSPIV